MSRGSPFASARTRCLEREGTMNGAGLGIGTVLRAFSESVLSLLPVAAMKVPLERQHERTTQNHLMAAKWETWTDPA